MEYRSEDYSGKWRESLSYAEIYAGNHEADYGGGFDLFSHEFLNGKISARMLYINCVSSSIRGFDFLDCEIMSGKIRG